MARKLPREDRWLEAGIQAEESALVGMDMLNGHGVFGKPQVIQDGWIIKFNRK